MIIVKFNNRAVRFENSAEMQLRYSLTADAQATRFVDDVEARRAVKRYRIKPPGLITYHDFEGTKGTKGTEGTSATKGQI